MAQDQRVEFLFAAQVTGQNELSRLTAAVDKLRQETDQLKGANAGLAASTEAVIRNGTRYNNMADAQSRELRRQRQGTQQLGMQFNDLATSISTGASPIQAFNQQLGQIGYAMSEMGGKAGAVGAFLAGPWGAAILIATMAIGAFAEKIMGADKASEELQKTEENLAKSKIALLESRYELGEALGKNIVSYKEVKAVALEAALGELASASAAVKASQIRMKAAAKEKETIDFLSATKPLGPGGSFAAGIAKMFGYGDTKGAVKKAKDDAAALNEATAEVNRATAALQKAINVKADKKSGSGSASKEKEKEDQIEINKSLQDYLKLLSGGIPQLTSYQQGVYGLQQAYGSLTPELQKQYAVQQEATLLQQDMLQIARDEKALQASLDGGLLPAIAALADKPTAAMDGIIARGEEMKSAFEGVGRTVSDAFQGMLTGATSFKDGMKGIISSVISELWRLYVVQQIVGFFTGTVGPALGFGLPGKAMGGSVGKNQPYMVGERGPELFIPGGSGTIIPNRNLGGGGGGNAFSINVDARGSADPAAVRAQVQQGILEAAPAIIAAAEARTVNGLRRPRLGGVMQ